MRSTAELAELPYAFATNRLLARDKFISELRDRGLHLSPGGLEALHQTGLLVPLLRLRRDGRQIATAHRRDPIEARQRASWQPTSRQDILEAANTSRLFDPATEQFMSRRRLKRQLGDFTYETSVYLYSPQQLIHAPIVRDALPTLSFRASSRAGTFLDARSVWKERWRAESTRLRDIVTAVVALETVYYPQVLGVLRLDSWGRDPLAEGDRYLRWRQKLPLSRMLRWLHINAQWLEEAATELLRLADLKDPLGSWAELVPYAFPEARTKLRGEARTAVDVRVAAEILFRYHDELVKAGRAKAPSKQQGRKAEAPDSRLLRRRSLDAVLSDLGLSPHPRVVLVVEGATEKLLFPRVMEFFGIRTEEDFIAIQDAGGADRDLAPLIAYVAPRLGTQERDRYVELVRPPTRVLVVFDPEGTAATAEEREARRGKWVERLMQTMPLELQRDKEKASVIRNQLDNLVDIATWTRTGGSFEFAHFTDRQLAVAIDRLDPRPRKPTVAVLTDLIRKTRSRRASLNNYIHGFSKVDLADELWPVLERRLRRGNERALRRIPIVRILDRALELAHEFGGARMVLALEPGPRRRRRRRG